MSKEKRRVPKLRFPGFTEDWEQRKLGEYANFRRGSFPQPYGNKEWYDGVGSAPFVQVVDVGDNLSLVECTKQRISKLAQPMSVYAEKGSVLVTLQGSIGRVAVSQYDAFIDRTILIFQGYKYKTNSYFWAYIIKNKFFEEALKAPGGTIKTITKEVLSNFIILYPKFSEQEQIGSFFEKLDKLITLHQRKLDNLKLKKKALLQKLFPKNGERYPELRFPGFTDAWEQRKLGDFYTFKNGLNKEKVYFGYGDSIVNFTDVFHNRQIYSSTLKGKVFVNKKELENFKVKEGDLFFTRTSETIDEIGFPAVVMEPMERVVFSGFVLRGRAEKNDPLVNIFKSYIFFTDNFRSEMKKKSSMTTRALTSGTALKEMYFSYPKDLEEQTKIGEILLRLDNVITLHQRKLDHLQLQKKALLQQMFV